MIDWMTKNNRYARAARSLMTLSVKWRREIFRYEVLSTTRAHTLNLSLVAFVWKLLMPCKWKRRFAHSLQRDQHGIIGKHLTKGENRFLSDAFVVGAVVASWTPICLDDVRHQFKIEHLTKCGLATDREIKHSNITPSIKNIHLTT